MVAGQRRQPLSLRLGRAVLFETAPTCLQSPRMPECGVQSRMTKVDKLPKFSHACLRQRFTAPGHPCVRCMMSQARLYGTLYQVLRRALPGGWARDGRQCCSMAPARIANSLVSATVVHQLW